MLLSQRSRQKEQKQEAEMHGRLTVLIFEMNGQSAGSGFSRRLAKEGNRSVIMFITCRKEKNKLLRRCTDGSSLTRPASNTLPSLCFVFYGRRATPAMLLSQGSYEIQQQQKRQRPWPAAPSLFSPPRLSFLSWY